MGIIEKNTAYFIGQYRPAVRRNTHTLPQQFKHDPRSRTSHLFMLRPGYHSVVFYRHFSHRLRRGGNHEVADLTS
jgi:hypothetical protein